MSKTYKFDDLDVKKIKRWSSLNKKKDEAEETKRVSFENDELTIHWKMPYDEHPLRDWKKDKNKEHPTINVKIEIGKDPQKRINERIK